jgi:hypothetical protein
MKTFITIVDTVIGRRPAGHQEDYLRALEAAFAPADGADDRTVDVQTFAPFRNGAGHGLRTSRLRRLVFLVRAYRAIVRARGPGVILLPSSDFIDFVAYYLAAHVRLTRPRVRALFVLRRDAGGIVGNGGWKPRLLEWIVRRTARAGTLHPVSDSRVALLDWQRLTGVRGSLIAIPDRRRPPDMPPRTAADPVTFGLVGLYRPEKGAAHYEAIVAGVVALPSPEVRIEVQLPDVAEDATHPAAARIRATWRDHPQVRLHSGHLGDDAYTRLICGIDVLLLPYDVASYGTGTSGIMHEVLALGGLVAATRITWAAAEFDGHPDVVWLDTPTEAADPALLERLRYRVLADRHGAAGGKRNGARDDFAESWANAIRDAESGPVSAFSAGK